VDTTSPSSNRTSGFSVFVLGHWLFDRGQHWDFTVSMEIQLWLCQRIAVTNKLSDNSVD
jgi:hypothetical protein